MCLISLAIDRHDRFPLVIAANRDERFARPAAPLDWWPDGGATPHSVSVLGGRDLASGGTWMALGSNARMAMLTNVRDPSRLRALAPSRGSIVPGWIASTHRAAAFWPAWAALPHNPFNLLAADFTERACGQWWWADDRSTSPVALGTGIHGLSNAGLATPWPKVRRLDAAMAQALNTSDASPASIERALFAALADRSAVADADLPDTGIGLARERLLGTAFINLPGADAASAYGTRCSTVLIVEREAGRCTARLVERSFDAAGSVTRQHGVRMPWPLFGVASDVVEEDVNPSRAPSPGAGCPPLRTAGPAA